MRVVVLISLFAAACTQGVVSQEGARASAAQTGTSPLPTFICTGSPDAGPATDWNDPIHAEASIALGGWSPNHRGIDLVASVSQDPQTVAGEIRYGTKALEYENVSLFACEDGDWQPIGNTTTDGKGNFALALTDDARLTVGVRSLYVSVDGDRSGARFLAIVTEDSWPVLFSDVDGTLTSSENAAAGGLIGLGVDANPGAADALNAMAQKGYAIVYVTAMMRTFESNRRAWLADKGFPAGGLVMPDDFVLPGSETVTYKSDAFTTIALAGLVPTVGLGNRASDEAAYSAAGVPASSTFLKLGQYDKEDQPLIDAGEAVGVTSYVDALPLFQAFPDAAAQ